MFKRVINYFVIFIFVLLLTSCGNSNESNTDSNKVVCSQENGGESYEIVAVLNEDVVESISAKANFETEEAAETYKTFLDYMSKKKEVDMGVSRDGSKIIIKNYAPVLESADLEVKILVIGKDKNNFIEIMKQQSFECK